jgi:hypothetical protein
LVLQGTATQTGRLCWRPLGTWVLEGGDRTLRGREKQTLLWGGKG